MPLTGAQEPCWRIFANGLLGPTFNGLDAFYEDSVAGFIRGFSLPVEPKLPVCLEEPSQEK